MPGTTHTINTEDSFQNDDESPSERNYENGASSSRRDQENISPLKLSKGKRTYGLQSDDDDDDDDDDSSEDENFDCELMEDSSGKLRAEWERAFLKRKGDLFSNNVNKNKQKHGQDSIFNGTHNEKRGKSHVGSDNDYDYEDGIPCGESSFFNHDDGGYVDVDCGKADMPAGKDECVERDEMYEEIPCSSNQKDGKDDVVNDSTIDDVSIEDSIIDQREKLKETEEYKRALEQELSARQIALKIQAEEAQQLRRLQKRKKAESLRLLDMERRQKQRVEEIRETQKKDEENMNLKEQYRTEVREELKKLEFMCRDMASLLRGLGIQVGDGPCPLSHEVRAAYKRALLSFHPDRASGSDMRQQVEAEEKFKLISRMKEKLSVRMTYKRALLTFHPYQVLGLR
ncbi:hypothetical protein L2E82_44688 [Cichorium intybus]|uniref:Uncharacterized protein n=1 Tax=Cichorium intybus TaxID=13427 RepID=A0ACB8ZR43_CICIN|nr:hypothetical protein L2E82_44688 [Cichorium intybus]